MPAAKIGGGLRVGNKSRKQTADGPARKQKTYTRGQITVRRALKNSIPAGTFARVGGNLGGIFGPAGAALGRGAGSVLSSITGMGDYEVKSNSIATSAEAIAGEVPHFGKADNSTRVKHREFVSDISVPVDPASFSNTSYVINPSNRLLFPWLAKFAENYQQYKVHGMVIYFKSTTSDYSAAGAMGKIAMATNYNVRDSDYANMQELENSEFAVSGKPSLSRLHPIECAPNNGVPVVKWIRDAQYDANPGGDDRLYDVGKFQFATQGLPGVVGTTLGELWVTYDIEFYKPIVGRDSASVVYTPVSVPVFDTLGGEGVNSLFQVENSELVPTSGITRDIAWETMLSPGKFLRTSTFDEPACKICYNSVRDAGDTEGAYPATWIGDSTLRLQRKGVYTIRLNMETDSNAPVIRQTTSYGAIAFNDHDQVTTSVPLSHFPRIEVEGDYDRYQVMSSNIAGFNNAIMKGDGQTGGAVGNQGAWYSTAGPTWYLVIWNKQDTYGGAAVTVKFFGDTPLVATNPTNGGTKFQYAGNQLFDVSNINRFKFTVGYVNVNAQTYYQPPVTAITSDDSKSLQQTVDIVQGLLPKLKALGIVV